jgi:hypothetical protein
VGYYPGLVFLSGTGTTTLTVNGFQIEVNATDLTLDQFSLFDTGSGLGRCFSTTRVQPLTLIPGSYRFGTLFGPSFVFSVTGTGKVDYDSRLTFLSGTSTTILQVNGFLLMVDATRLTPPSFSLNDSASGLGEPFPTAVHQCVILIPGPYILGCGFLLPFSVTAAGMFDFNPAFAPCVTGLGTQRLRVSCDPTAP